MKTLVCVALVIIWAGAAVGAPAIVATPSSGEVTVESGALVTQTYTLTNSGDETLSITRVLASCGCTTTTLAKSQLAPGESVDLTAKIDTKGFAGKVIKTVTVQSNDPVQPNLILRETINILPSAEAGTEAAAPTPVVATPIPATAAPTPASTVAPTTASPEATPTDEPSTAWTEPVIAAGALAVLAAGVVTVRALRKRSSAKD